MKIRSFVAAAALPLMLFATAAHAQDAAPASEPSKAETGEAEEADPPFTLEGEVGLFSDYRFRGISLSNEKPEATASLTLSHSSGLYAGAWFSNVDLGNGKANNLETDLSAGWSGDVGPINVDVGGVYYLYASHSDFNYYEILGSIGHSIGGGEIRAGFAFAPKQSNLGDQSNRYYYVSGDFPIAKTPFSVHGSVGHEDGAFADKKIDYLVGASLDIGGGFTTTADYIDTHRAFEGTGGPTVVVSIKKSF